MSGVAQDLWVVFTPSCSEARAVASALFSSAVHSCIVRGSALHNLFLHDVFQACPPTGLRQDAEAFNDSSLQRDYHANPGMLIKYIDARRPLG